MLRVNTGLRRGLEGAYTGVTLGDVALQEFMIAREHDIMFQVIGRDVAQEGGDDRGGANPTAACRTSPT